MENIVYASVPCLRVINVRAFPDYKLHLTFSNGKSRLFDFKPLLAKAIYAPLNNLNLFLKAQTDGCGVIWNEDIDIDPTYLYEHGAEA